jgi:hypothetical protein
VLGALLGGGAGFGPDAGFQIDVSRARGLNLTASRAGQEKQAEDIRSVLIVVFGKGSRQPLDLCT